VFVLVGNKNWPICRLAAQFEFASKPASDKLLKACIAS
jgi:hypothetical protein